jgi:hypothetical protein
MRAKKNREINVFSTSAIDLFASSMGVFILLVVITLPFYTKTSTTKSQDLQLKEKEIQELRQQLNAELKKIEPLQKQIEELKKIKLPAEPKTLPPPDDSTELKQKVATLQKQVEAREEEIKKIQDSLEEMENQEKTIESLEEQLEKVKAIQLRHFLVIVLKWSTERHDIDLELQSPEGLTYNFKTKNHAKGSGQFALDSRTGPGAELWQSANAPSGRYKVRASFYNNYGNKSPAKISLTALSQTGTYDLPAFEMDFDKQKNKEITFTLADDGKINFE